MKSVNQISTELSNNLSSITSYDKTRILVLCSRIIDKPYTNHRLELNYYSIRYKASDKMVYVYGKNFGSDDNYDFDYVNEIEFPIDFSVKVIVEDKMSLILKLIRLKMRMLLKMGMK